MLLLAGCIADGPTFGISRAGEDPRTLVFNNATEPEFIDPTQATGHPDGRIAQEIFDGLTEYGPIDLSPQPSHALSWDTHPDGRGYTFHLRDDAVWSDGTPVTARDYAWSWEHVLNPAYLSRYAQQLYFVERAPLYNSSRVFIGDDGAVLEATGSNVVALTDDLDELDDGSVHVVAARTDTELELVYRAGCPDLADLLALFDCSGPELRKTVSLELTEAAWPMPNQRVLTEDVVLHTPGGEVPLSRGEEVVLIGGGKVFYPTSEKTGTLDASKLADPRAEHIRYDLVELEPIDWSGEGRGDTGAPSELPPLTRTASLSELRVSAEVLGFRVEDDHTFTVRLSGVAPFFLTLTSHTTLRAAPRQAWEEHGSRWTRPGNIVSSGPFLLETHIVRDRFELVANPDWYDGENLAFDRVIAYSIDNLHTSANLYRAGYTDFVVANDIPAEFIPMLKDKEDFTVSPALSVYVYRINTTKPPFDDARVRRALAMAVNREDVVKVLKAGQLPADHIVPPGLPGYDPARGPGFDPEAARALLAEAGYPGGEGFPETRILYNTLETHKLVAAIVQDNWAKELGIDVQLENREWKTYLKTVNNLDYDVARGGWIGDYLDPLTFLELWIQDGGNNNTGWTDPRYDALIHEASQTSDPADRLAVLAEAEKLLNEEMPFIPIYHYVWTDLTQPDVKGTHPNLLDQHAIRYMHIER